MRRTTNITTVGVSLAISGLLLVSSMPLLAQESPQGQMGHKGMRGMMGKDKSPGMMGDMQRMHEQHEQMHQEMTQELQKQMTALRDHTKAMEGVSDEKQLLTEMKKHQQMTDRLLGTMMEQREKMHATMKAQHEKMHGMQGTAPQSEPQSTEGHEAHH